MLLNHTIGPSEAAALEAALARWRTKYDVAARRSILSNRGADAVDLAAIAAEIECARLDLLYDEIVLGYRLKRETQAEMLIGCGILPGGWTIAYDHDAPRPDRPWKVGGPDGASWHAESCEHAAAVIRTRMVAAGQVKEAG